MNIEIYILIAGYTKDGRESVGRCLTIPQYTNQAMEELIKFSGITQLIHKETRPVVRR